MSRYKFQYYQDKKLFFSGTESYEFERSYLAEIESKSYDSNNTWELAKHSKHDVNRAKYYELFNKWKEGIYDPEPWVRAICCTKLENLIPLANDEDRTNRMYYYMSTSDRINEGIEDSSRVVRELCKKIKSTYNEDDQSIC